MSLCPTGKAAYLSKVDAQLAMLRHLNTRKVRVAPVRAYRCRACDLWHTTSHSHRGKQRVR